MRTKDSKTNKPCTIQNVSSSTDKQPKTLLECGVCWGGGEIDINDDMETVKCWNCNGTGMVKNY